MTVLKINKSGAAAFIRRVAWKWMQMYANVCQCMQMYANRCWFGRAADANGRSVPSANIFNRSHRMETGIPAPGHWESPLCKYYANERGLLSLRPIQSKRRRPQGGEGGGGRGGGGGGNWTQHTFLIRFKTERLGIEWPIPTLHLAAPIFTSNK